MTTKATEKIAGGIHVIEKYINRNTEIECNTEGGPHNDEIDLSY